jgi:hypothetical protein
MQARPRAEGGGGRGVCAACQGGAARRQVWSGPLNFAVGRASNSLGNKRAGLAGLLVQMAF